MNRERLFKHIEQLEIRPQGENSRGWILAKCPFAPFLHDRGIDRRPSFFLRVNEEGISGFNCFTCGQKGSISGLYRKLGHLRGENYMAETIEAEMDEIPDDFGDYEKGRPPRKEAEPLDESPFVGLYPAAWDMADARTYLIDREITQEASEKLDLLYDPDEHRILFPVRGMDQGLYGFTGRTILDPEEYPYPDFPKVRDYAGLMKDQLLLGEHLCQEGRITLLVEGLFGLARLISLGLDDRMNLVACMGSNLSRYQGDRLIDFSTGVYLLFDDDAAGDKGIYGPRRNDGSFSGGGAIDILKDDVPTFICPYPDDLENNDIDFLDRKDILWMIGNSDSPLDIMEIES